MKKVEPDDHLNTLKREIDVICGYGASLKTSILAETQISEVLDFPSLDGII
jgi:hypothetical protein